MKRLIVKIRNFAYYLQRDCSLIYVLLVPARKAKRAPGPH